MDRKFTCKGFGKTYEIEAPNHAIAQSKAASQYKEETRRVEPVSFLIYFFSTEVVDRKKTGRKSTMPGRGMGEEVTV